MNADLHTHTKLSDGSLTATELLSYANSAGVNCLSITNHDAFTPLLPIQSLAKSLGIELIDGVEMSSMDTKRNRRVHILCYSPKDKTPLLKLCQETTQNRMVAGEKMAKAVCEKYPINLEQIKNIADGCIFKQHIMQALLNAGICTEIYGETQKKLFYDGSPFMEDCVQPDVYSVLDAAKKSGAIIVMAHPFTYDGIDIMHEMIGKNLLDGIEVWSSKSNEKQESFLFDIATKNNLIMTGGSDFHGAYSSNRCTLGQKPTPKKSIEIIKNNSK